MSVEGPSEHALPRSFTAHSYLLLQCCNTGNAIEDDSRFGVGWSLVFRKTKAQDVFFQEPAFSRLRRGDIEQFNWHLVFKARFFIPFAAKEVIADNAICSMLGFLCSQG